MRANEEQTSVEKIYFTKKSHLPALHTQTET